MTIMLNSDVLLSDSFRAPKSMNVIAGDGGGTFSRDNFPCLANGFCDQSGQNYLTIVNPDSTSSGYGLASFECGKLTGGAALLTDCNNFQGNTYT